MTIDMECRRVGLAIMDSCLMDLSNEINSVLSLNKHSDASQEKVTEKIRDKVKKFLLGSNAASSVRHPNLLSQAPTIEMFMRGIAE